MSKSRNSCYVGNMNNWRLYYQHERWWEGREQSTKTIKAYCMIGRVSTKSSRAYTQNELSNSLNVIYRTISIALNIRAVEKARASPTDPIHWHPYSTLVGRVSTHLSIESGNERNPFLGFHACKLQLFCHDQIYPWKKTSLPSTRILILPYLSSNTSRH